MTITKCGCGRRMSRYASACRTCSTARLAKCHAESAVHVGRGTCPDCRAALKRNLALTGWWQCVGYGTACGFQCFTAA